MTTSRVVVTTLLALAGLASGCREGGEADDDPGGPADAAPPADAPPDPHPGEIVLMTWNLQTFPKAPSTAARVQQLLRQYGPDLVAVQEIDDVPAFEALDAAMPEYRGLLANDAFGDIRVGFLVREGAVEIDRTETLFASDDYAFPRPPLLVHAKVEGIDFTAVALHLKATGTDDSQARRAEAIGKLDAWAQGELALAGAERELVLLGDWNDKLTDPPADNVFAAMLARPESYTFLTLPLAEQEDQQGGTYIPSESFIDHVMITNDLLADYHDATVQVLRLDDADAQYHPSISDHRPVLVRFRPVP
jgi:endonuclease/exonuclease/phosphatase family metal-dependent hydrolase